MLKEQHFYVTVYKLLQELFLYFLTIVSKGPALILLLRIFFFIYEILCTILDPLFDSISFIFIFTTIENRNGVNKLTNLLNFY